MPSTTRRALLSALTTGCVASAGCSLGSDVVTDGHELTLVNSREVPLTVRAGVTDPDGELVYERETTIEGGKLENAYFRGEAARVRVEAGDGLTGETVFRGQDGNSCREFDNLTTQVLASVEPSKILFDHGCETVTDDDMTYERSKSEN